MAKQSQLDKAIDSINGQIKVLQLAREHLYSQQLAKRPAKVRKPKFPTAKAAGVSVVNNE